MGKRYYCDYCDKTIVATPSTIKTHNNGAVHQKLVNDHYQQYKDPETILKEETAKKPCIRHATGQCPFGSICRFSHYSPQEIAALQNYVAQWKTDPSQTSPSIGDVNEKIKNISSKNEPSNDNQTIIYDSNGVTYVLPWSYNTDFDKYENSLPPSLKRFKVEDFTNISLLDWG